MNQKELDEILENYPTKDLVKFRKLVKECCNYSEYGPYQMNKFQLISVFAL